MSLHIAEDLLIDTGVAAQLLFGDVNADENVALAELARSIARMLWMGVRKKAAYLPG